MVSKEQDAPVSAGIGGRARADRRALSGRRALVIGGSGGIGAAISRELASRGADLIVHGRSAEKVQTVVRDIQAMGAGSAEGLVFDIQSPSGLLAAVSGLGTIDVLVVAFGPFVRKSLSAHTAEDWSAMAALNLALPGALTSLLLPSMLERKFGRMLFLGGTRTDTIRGYLSNAAYAAAKTGLDVLAKSIALEGSSSNVAAVTVCPGLVETEYLEGGNLRALKGMAPGGRLIRPEEIAEIAVDLIDCDPCISSGAIVSLDSGFHA
jgi:NAD(P)-dependent dehydrogenase (short-subunit alcohol dehydrogenase family)